MKKYLYIPMEIIDRELDGNCMLACEAVELGWDVVLGPRASILGRIETLPRGVYLLKSIVPGQVDTQDRIIASGSKVACLDQEGMLQRPGIEYRLRFSPESIDKAEKIFFWGESQKRDFKDTFDVTDDKKLIVTGSPRAEYWINSGLNPQDSYHVSYNKKYGNYILFATSLGNVNHALGEHGQINMLLSSAGLFGKDDEARKELIENAKDRRALAEFLIGIYEELLLNLADSVEDRVIILRPHPSENIERWKEVIAGRENVVIDVDGSPTGWIKGADCLVQYGSTMALEAALLKVPVVTLTPELPDNLKYLNLHYPEVVSIVSNTVRGMVGEILGIISKSRPLKKIFPTDISDILAYDEHITSSRKILEQLEKISVETDELVKVRLNVGWNSIRLEVKSFIVYLVTLTPFARFLPSRFRQIRYRYKYGKRKVKALLNDDVAAIVESVQKVNKNKREECSFRRLKDNVFLFYKEEK